MALVAYDDSDSDEEHETDMKDGVAKKLNDGNVNTNNKQNENIFIENKLKLPPVKAHEDRENETFLKLPQPKESRCISIIEEDDEFLKKREKPEIKPPPPTMNRKPVKIQLTALSQLQDDESPLPAIPLKKSSEYKSGLLGMLPSPKEYIVSNKSKKSMMVPHVLTKKPPQKPIPKTNNNVDMPIIKNAKSKSNKYYDSSDESDSESQVENSSNQNSDFFSLNEEYKLPDVPYEHIDFDIKEKNNKLMPAQNNSIEIPISFENIDTDNTHTHEEKNNDELHLDEEALRQLCGSRAKRFKPESIQLIDMSHKDVLPSEEEWMREALQEATAGPKISHAVKPLGGPSSTQKRKHQITYLAQQAKANEQELQNQWANNRMTRRQTQSKYGF
uniref:Putative proline-rich protein prcc n=1 Tax=Xenopsylla cheopis TaxID=163159 RepID=A0A6M2DN32_XENCH